ncbi:MAG: mechanosensitive ion channel domain-containing protein [Nanoarchaeota archaeon]|nr:mechanosensitive ion channel family protein [Nanoarchaeota archaeon]
MASRKNLHIKWDKLILPIVIFLLILIIYLFFPSIVNLDNSVKQIFKKILMGILFLVAGLIINKVFNILIKREMNKFDIEKKDNLKERKTHTQMKYLKTVINIIITLVSLALALRQFESMKQLSTGILASAGVIGIMVAFSAQKLFANILAGFVIAFSQPIRIDDVVIVEGEWGRIEEINTTNVIVKVWDQRRIVLPITYFVEKPFQNWTKTSADIWGTTDFYVDYNMPVEEMRTELGKILKSTKLWDGKINSLQVTDLNEKTMKIRALMSAKDSSEAWDLRCYVREKMINFMQEKYPDKLPKIRAEIKNK